MLLALLPDNLSSTLSYISIVNTTYLINETVVGLEFIVVTKITSIREVYEFY